MGRKPMFTDAQVVIIRTKYHTTQELPNGHQDKHTVRSLATDYHCSYQTIFKLIKGITYEWVVTEYD